MRRTLALLALLTAQAAANSWAPPYAKIISGHGGRYALKVIPVGVDPASASARGAQGILLKMQPDGQLKQVWKVTMPNYPKEVLVGDRGEVITLDTYATGTDGNALVVYGHKGQILANYSITQLIPDKAFRHTLTSMDGIFLTNTYTPQWRYASQLHLALMRGNSPVLVVNAVTGQIKTPWNDQARP